jgi:hypothetical protein
MMRAGFEHCNFCGISTYLKIKDFKRENKDGLQVDTSVKEGRCNNCGRLMHIVEVKATEEKPSV